MNDNNIMEIIKTKIKKELSGVRQEIANKTVGYIVTALGLVAGLAWNDAIKSAIEHFFPSEQGGIRAKFIYAATITLVVVIVSVYLIKILGKNEKEKKDKK
ncbi:MAG TPA: DUF5654 family protein [Patescibacteria group bacterium]|nr:DUF5654 family protein [Patescibacteria group bacterium]